MRRRYLDFSLLVAFIASLAIHASLYQYARHAGPGGNVVAQSTVRTASTQPTLIALLEPEPPAPRPFLDPRDDFGEHAGTGRAMDSSPGDTPLQSHLGDQEQAFLDRTSKQESTGSPVKAQPGQAGQPTVQPAASPPQAVSDDNKLTPKPEQPAKNDGAHPDSIKPVQDSPPAPPRTSVHQEPVIANEETKVSSKQDDVGKGNEPVLIADALGNLAPREKPAPKPAGPAVSPATQESADSTTRPAQVVSPPLTVQIALASDTPHAPSPPAPQPPVQASVQRSAGRPVSAAASAPPSDKDSDPFAKVNSMVFVNGQVHARDGRWVKTVKPHFTDAGTFDAITMPEVRVMFLATVDVQGNVINVRRYRSSGSDNIDLPCERALNEWKIEPSHDATGRPIQDVVPVTFVIPN